MNPRGFFFVGFVFALVCCFGSRLVGQQPPGKPVEADLRKNYEKFMHALDFQRVVKDYPKALDNLDSGDPERQLAGLSTLCATGEPEVIPWMVPLLESPEGRVRIYAAMYIEKMVSAHCLKRRDGARPGRVVLKPLGANDLDLRALAWVVQQMAHQADDGDTQAYAVSLIRYLELKDFEGVLRGMLQSRHPAVSHKAKWALEELGFKAGRPSANGENFSNR
jgi:hypothetical protein